MPSFSEEEIFIFQKNVVSNSFINEIQEETLSSDANIIFVNEETLNSNVNILYITDATINSNSKVKVLQEKTLTSNTLITKGVNKYIYSDAHIYSITTPVNLFPLNNEDMDLENEEIRFYIPYGSSGDNMDIQLDIYSGSRVILTLFSWQFQSRWTYWDGSSFVQWPVSGIGIAQQGNEARINIDGLIDSGIFNWRVRGVVRK